MNTTAFAVLALRAAGRGRGTRRVRARRRWLAGQANRDGGFNFAGRGGPSGADDTGAAVQALAAAGRRGTRVVRARRRAGSPRRQNPDGGFPLQRGASNAQSTAWAVQGLIAAGRDPDAVRRARLALPARLPALAGHADGAIRYSRTSAQTPVWVTAQALTALAGKPFPLAPPGRALTARRGGASRARPPGAP